MDKIFLNYFNRKNKDSPEAVNINLNYECTSFIKLVWFE